MTKMLAQARLFGNKMLRKGMPALFIRLTLATMLLLPQLATSSPENVQASAKLQAAAVPISPAVAQGAPASLYATSEVAQAAKPATRAHSTEPGTPKAPDTTNAPLIPVTFVGHMVLQGKPAPPSPVWSVLVT